MTATSSRSRNGSIRFISQLLKSLWLFFPGILFLLFSIFIFWTLGQGKDIIVAFTENQSQTRIVFFLAIGFWVYVNWYSSRIISYIKRSKQEQLMLDMCGTDKKAAANAYEENRPFFEIGIDFLDEIPRVIGNACFLILELAVFQSPVLSHPISVKLAFTIFIVVLLLLRFLNNLVLKKQAQKTGFRTTFYVMLVLLIIAFGIVSMLPQKINIQVLFGLLLLFHIVFIIYINLRRVQMERKAAAVKVATQSQVKSSRSLLERLMDFFCVPRKESGYFKYFLFVGFVGIICYLLAINSLSFARNIGPFPFLILAFGVLLAFLNTVTAFSIRLKINFHFVLFILALIISTVAVILGMGETHNVRTVDLKNNSNNYDQRPPLVKYLKAWLNDRHISDTSKDDYDVYFVMSNGGASRSGYWTAAVLGKLEDASLANHLSTRFSDHVFCLSGTSGGGVGVATFFSLLRDKEQQTKPLYDSSAREFLKQDYFSYTFARMLGPDFFNYIFHFSSKDRATALESSFEESSKNNDPNLYRVPFNEPFSSFPAMKGDKVNLPVLFVNTTRMQDGNPGVVTNLQLDSTIFNNRVDVLGLLNRDSDITITSASILGARFPYLSPAGNIGNNYFVDGGYFDNSGAGVVQELIRGIVNAGNDDSSLAKKIRKLHFKVLHITNSPIDLAAANMQRVAPIKNDLMAPILTIVGAYDMQTTVNDGRLLNYVNDLNKYNYKGKADYMQISLYKDSTEWSQDTLFRSKRFTIEPPYAMNWFMSDTTLRRINLRLGKNNNLDSLVRRIKSQR